MQRLLLSLVLVAAAGVCPAGEMGSRAMSGWFNVTSENGWRGRRYMDGSQIIAEEFSTGRSGRIDVWRFYRRGVLSSEERDLNGDGKVDLQTRWDSRSGLMTGVMRDSNKRGVNDIEIELTGNQRWEIREDRNLDGVTDRILYLSAPNDLFERLGTDFAGRGDVTSNIPREYWREMHSDDAYTGSITDYYRYNTRGVLTQYGEWDGRRITWRRCPPDFVPVPTVAPSRAYVPEPIPQGQPTRSYAGDPDMYDGPATTVRDPFDLVSGPSDLDPYAGGTGTGPVPPTYNYGQDYGYGQEYGEPTGGYLTNDPYAVQPQMPPPAAPQGTYADNRDPSQRAAGSDVIGRGAVGGGGSGSGGGGGGGGDRPAAVRSRGDDLSIQDSSARAIPARMRPPGTTTTRRR